MLGNNIHTFALVPIEDLNRSPEINRAGNPMMALVFPEILGRNSNAHEKSKEYIGTINSAQIKCQFREMHLPSPFK